MITTSTTCANGWRRFMASPCQRTTGEKYRQIMVDIDPAKLLAQGLAPIHVVNAVNAQNLSLPSGTAKIGDTQFVVQTNAMPKTIDELNAIPIKCSNGATVFLRDIGFVRDGYAVQQNIVREGGVRAVLLSIIKNKEASTLDVVNGGQERARRCARSGAAGPPDQRAVRRVGLRCLLRDGGVARGRHRRRTDGTDDPGVPGFVAPDPGDELLPSYQPAIGMMQRRAARGTLVPSRCDRLSASIIE